MKNKTEEFSLRANLKHNEKYNYSLVNYINAQTKVKIICPIHNEFEQRPYRHLVGDGCPKCSGRSKNIADFILSSNMKHNNKYNYSLVDIKEIKNDDKTTIICPIHGQFKQKVSSHLNGCGCPKCGGSERMDKFIFEQKGKITHNDKYVYSLVKYINNKTKVKIICKKHGEFEQRPDNHLKGQGCPICKESKGEKAVRRYLLDNNIIFKKQHKFIDCKNKKRLPFDFYLPDYNICIEYDGKQHFEPIDRFGGNDGLIKIKESDSIKNKFCIDKKIKLIRISYLEIVDEKLNKEIK